MIANAGTPLMWAAALHLMLGNVVLGVLEGLALASWFRLPKPTTILWMIGANYVSAWAGWLLLSYALPGAVTVDVHNAWRVLGVAAVVAWAVTLVLEFPFAAFAARRAAHAWRKAIVGTIGVQTASCALLAGWYWATSATGFYTDARLVAPSAMAAPRDVHVYYIGDADGAAYSTTLAGAVAAKVADLGSHGRNDRLFARAEPGQRWDLVARLATGDHQPPRLVVVTKSFAAHAVPTARATGTDTPPEEVGTWDNFGQVPKLGAARDSSWKFYVGFWAWIGLDGQNTATGARARIAFETPVAAWMVRNSTHLPGDTVLFQLGDDKICLYDPNSKTVALIARGRGPVAAIR